MTPLQRAALTVGILIHGALVWSVVSQPLDPHVPPVSRRFATASLSFDSTHWPGPGGDFFALYHAGLQVRAGRSPHELAESPRITPYFFRYIYSPLLAWTLGRAVTTLAPRNAYLLWAATIECCLFAWLAVMWRSGLDAASRTAATILLLVNQPYLLELHMGQFTFVAIVLTLVAMRLLATVSRAGGMLGAGVLLAMATVLKTFPLVTVPAMVRERRARLAALGAAVALAAILIASAGGPAGPFSLGGEDLVGVPHPGAYSLVQAAFVLVLAILHVWLPTALPLLPAAIVLGAAAATAVVVWRRSPEVVPGAAVMLIVFFLGFFHTWEHHYSGAIVAGTALLLPARGAVAQSQRPALLVCLALLALPTPYALLPTPWTAAQWIALSLSKALPLCGAFVVGLRSIQQTANSSVSL